MITLSLKLFFTLFSFNCAHADFLEKTNSFFNIYHYQKESYYNSSKNKISSNDYYEKTDFNLYLERNLSSELLLYGNIILSNINSKRGDATDLTSTSFGALKTLHKDQKGNQLELGPSLYLPLYSTKNTNLLGSRSIDLDLKIKYKHTFTTVTSYPFTSIELGQKFRTGVPRSQYFSNLEVGHRFLKGHLHLLNINYIRSYHLPSNINNKEVSADDYMLLKFTTSLVFKAYQNNNIQVGFSHDYKAENSGAGQTFFLGIWRLTE